MSQHQSLRDQLIEANLVSHLQWHQVGNGIDEDDCRHPSTVVHSRAQAADVALAAIRAHRECDLISTLAEIRKADADYDRRYGLVLKAIHLAHELGWRAGFGLDPAEPDWPVAYIELPTGQVSWHMPAHPDSWDGHTTEEKFERIRALVEQHYQAHQADEDEDEGEVGG